MNLFSIRLFLAPLGIYPDSFISWDSAVSHGCWRNPASEHFFAWLAKRAISNRGYLPTCTSARRVIVRCCISNTVSKQFNDGPTVFGVYIPVLYYGRMKQKKKTRTRRWNGSLCCTKSSRTTQQVIFILQHPIRNHTN